MAEGTTGEIRAAGAVLWRPAPAGPPALEVALVHRQRYDDWSFPKGKSLPREHALATAVREVAEETGVRVVLGRRLPSACYVSDGRPKRVDYWAARPAAMSVFAPNAEVDEISWLPLEAAGERLTYPHDVAVLTAFASAPAATTPVILLRHASAVSKNGWRAAGHADDLARPLTQRGQAQSRALAWALGCFGPARAVSSRAERCLATVRPYSELTGADVDTEPALQPGGDPGVQSRLVGSIIASAEPTLICAHRENLPCLLSLVCERLGTAVPDGPPLRKGAFWVLQTAGGRLVSSEHHHLSA